MIRTITIALLSLLLATPALGGWDEAVAAFERGNFAVAAREWRLLAEKNDAFSQTMLGTMYESGQGVPQDYVEAVKWYRQAAEQGNSTAQFLLGSSYANGHGVPQDNVQAYKWYDLAANAGIEISVRSRDVVAKRMTPADLSRAQKLAREWRAEFEARKKAHE